MILERAAKETLTPFGLNKGDTLRFRLGGGVWEMTLLSTRSEVTARGFTAYHDPGHAHGDISAYAFDADVRINGREHTLRREVGTQASFYEPWEIDGVRLWFDAAACAFKDRGGFIEEKDWKTACLCKPAHETRFAAQRADLAICPEPLHPWYPNPERQISIRNCYHGEDCWMGPYNGGAAHCGLDINMPAGTVLTAPISFDDHYLAHSTAAGFGNNRWRGVRRWPDGSQWQLQTSHLIAMLAPEHTPLPRGAQYATAAGTAVGMHEHTHFSFRVFEQGGEYLLDPWILFWAAFRDAADKAQ